MTKRYEERRLNILNFIYSRLSFVLGFPHATLHSPASPDGSFVSIGAWNLDVPDSNTGHRGCAYTVLQTVQIPGMYSAAYGTLHYKELLKSFEKRVVHSPVFGLSSVPILPWLCRKRRKAIFTYSPCIPPITWPTIIFYVEWNEKEAQSGAWRTRRSTNHRRLVVFILIVIEISHLPSKTLHELR